MRLQRDLGDFQTPPELVDAVLRTLGPIGTRWPRVLEPTCGQGRFLAGLMAASAPPRELIGIEIQESHVREARARALGSADARVEIIRANLFDLDLRKDLPWSDTGPLLIVGNPPWVTSAELGRLRSNNLPSKRNVKTLRGIEARTGASNFDLAEAVWLKLIDELADQAPTIALLCKTSVARGILQFSHRARLPIAEASMHRIDAPRWFGASVAACLLRVVVGAASTSLRIPVFADLEDGKAESEMGFNCGVLIADVATHQRSAFALGTSPLTWRQGLKHDAASVMELNRDLGRGPFRNRTGAIVDVEAEYLFPLVKGTDLQSPAGERPSRAVIVTQRRIGDDTRRIARDAPRLWSYLQAHARAFEARKSSIYRGRPPFALFGVGDYSFSPYKVAICGLHKTPRFRALGPVDGRPTMLDDTCYLLPCQTPAEAAVLTALANTPATLDLIRSASFLDAKRPVTKGLLQRIDLSAVLDCEDRRLLEAQASKVLEEDLSPRPGEVADVAVEIERLEGTLSHSTRP